MGFADAIEAAEEWPESPTEVVVVGPRHAATTQALWAVAAQARRPGCVTLQVEPDATLPAPLAALLDGRLPHTGEPVAYVCRGFVCDRPTSDPAALRASLDAAG